MSNSVTIRYQPKSQIDGEPSLSVVVGVAVQRGRFPAQDVFQFAVRQVPAVRRCDHN